LDGGEGPVKDLETLRFCIAVRDRIIDYANERKAKRQLQLANQSAIHTPTSLSPRAVFLMKVAISPRNRESIVPSASKIPIPKGCEENVPRQEPSSFIPTYNPPKAQSLNTDEKQGSPAAVKPSEPSIKTITLSQP